MNDNKESYRRLLLDRRWMEKRAKIIKRDDYKCAICGAKFNLSVHHKQYQVNKRTNKRIDPWRYDDRYLITVCSSCHKKGHEMYEIPIKLI